MPRWTLLVALWVMPSLSAAADSPQAKILSEMNTTFERACREKCKTPCPRTQGPRNLACGQRIRICKRKCMVETYGVLPVWKGYFPSGNIMSLLQRDGICMAYWNLAANSVLTLDGSDLIVRLPEHAEGSYRIDVEEKVSGQVRSLMKEWPQKKALKAAKKILRKLEIKGKPAFKRANCTGGDVPGWTFDIGTTHSLRMGRDGTIQIHTAPPEFKLVYDGRLEP